MSDDRGAQSYVIQDRAADGLQRLACLVRSDSAGQSDAANQIAHYRNVAAARLDSMAIYMRETDWPTMMRDAGEFARRRPEVLVVGGFLAGFLVARYLGPSRRRQISPWRSTAGRWHEALQKGAQVVSSAADTLRETAESQGLSPGTVVEKVGKHLALVGDRIIGGSMKATTLLKNDHAAVKRLMAEFGRTTARAVKRREALMDQIAQELEIHSTIEEEIFYPAVRRVRGGQSLVTEAKSEHKKVDSLVAEAQGMSMDTDEVLEKVEELREAVVHHATEEEREMFPVAEDGLGDQLQELGEQMAARKKELETSRFQQAKRAVKKVLRKTA